VTPRAAAIAVGVLAVLPPTAAGSPTYFDSRERRAPVASAAAADARASLARRLGPQGVVQLDPVTGTPRVVARLDGFLTGPSSRRPAQIAMSYLRRTWGPSDCPPAISRSCA
jgi:extracellular elastinolytic metalloproteinase